MATYDCVADSSNIQGAKLGHGVDHHKRWPNDPGLDVRLYGMISNADLVGTWQHVCQGKRPTGQHAPHHTRHVHVCYASVPYKMSAWTCCGMQRPAEFRHVRP